MKHACLCQEDLPALYRGHDAFLFTSRYEAWGMPVLEAMASGLAVVSSRCLGVDSFAVHARTHCWLTPRSGFCPGLASRSLHCKPAASG